MNIYKYKYSTKTSRHLAVQNICCFENEALFLYFWLPFRVFRKRLKSNIAYF